MDLLPSSEQEQIITMAMDFMATEMPLERIKNGQADAPSSERWEAMAELGWFGITVHQDLGGVGYGLAEEALLFRAAGRFLAPVSTLATSLAARLMVTCGAEELLSRCLKGEVKIALAVPETKIDNERGRLSGRFRIIDGRGADFILFLSQDQAALCDGSLLGGCDEKSCLDPSASLHIIELNGAHPDLVDRQVASDLYAIGMILVAALAVGTAEAICEMAVTHAKDREQFGRPIGVFQAIKHPCADMAMRNEAAFSQMCYAALALDSCHNDAVRQAAAARYLAGHAGLTNARANIQIHGALGMTDEFNAHLHLKRAHLLDVLLPVPKGALL